MIDTLAPPDPSLRTRTYRSILRGARAKGISEEAIRDCVFAFRGENPDADELRAALRDYVPSEDEWAEVLRRERQRGRPRRAEVLTEYGWRPA